MRIEKAIRSVCMGIGLVISILIPVSAQATCVLYLTVPVYDGQTWTERCDVQVNGVVVPDPPGCTEVVRIAWDWGDGFVGNSWFPAQHTYDTNGLYDVTVTPYDVQGGSVSQTIQIPIESCKTIVDIDIKPGSYPNSINVRSRGVIPVAILTTDTFDALQVDVDSVRFGPSEATESKIKAYVADVDGDGDADLVLHFKTRETGIVCGDTEATLTGETWDGIGISGTDSIKTVSCQ